MPVGTHVSNRIRSAVLGGLLLAAGACSDPLGELQKEDWRRAAQIGEACAAMGYPITMSDGQTFRSRDECERSMAETWLLLNEVEREYGPPD